jgi:hypothetical protein
LDGSRTRSAPQVEVTPQVETKPKCHRQHHKNHQKRAA